MLKWVGALLVVGGGTALGLEAAGRLTTRVRCLSSLLRAEEWMERELSFRLTPVPALLESIAARTSPPIRGLFCSCVSHMRELGEKSFGELWREAVRETGLPLKEDERQAVCSLGDILGRFDAEGQCVALREGAAELREYLRRAEQERDRLCRVYTTLGVGSSLLLVILLI